MRKLVVIFTAVMIGSALIGCNKNDKAASSPVVVAPPVKPIIEQPPVPIGDKQGTLGWTLKYQAKCQEGTAIEECVGAYGFTVLTDGRFQVGPSASGETKTGSLSGDEINALSLLLAPVLTMSEVSAENHAVIDEVELDDTLIYTRGSSDSVTLVHQATTDLAFRTSSAEQAKAILEKMKELASKYYSAPFPDTCKESVASIQTFLSSLQTCTADNECAYLDQNLNVLDANSSVFVTTDNCSLVQPLAAGNINLVATNQDKWLDSIQAVQNACGDRYYRADCSDFSGFNLTGASAVCKQGLCQSGVVVSVHTAPVAPAPAPIPGI